MHVNNVHLPLRSKTSLCCPPSSIVTARHVNNIPLLQHKPLPLKSWPLHSHVASSMPLRFSSRCSPSSNELLLQLFSTLEYTVQYITDYTSVSRQCALYPAMRTFHTLPAMHCFRPCRPLPRIVDTLPAKPRFCKLRSAMP
jgi:hypothetical protein